MELEHTLIYTTHAHTTVCLKANVFVESADVCGCVAWLMIGMPQAIGFY